MEKKPTQSRKGVKGGFPLAGSRGSAPCGVWGNAPTVPRPTNPKEASNKGAGSEASLPVTLRSRRSAPKLLCPLLAHCRARWARPHSRSTTPRPCFPPPNGYPNPKGYKGTTAQFVGSAGDAFSAICFLQKSRFTSSKPSISAIASDKKCIRHRTNSFVRYCPRKTSGTKPLVFSISRNIHFFSSAR